MGGTLHSYCNKNPEVDRHIKTQKVLSEVFFFSKGIASVISTCMIHMIFF